MSEGITILVRASRVSLRRQRLDKDLMGTRNMALGLPKEMCFRNGEKQWEVLNVGVTDTFEEQQYSSLTGAGRVNTSDIGIECRTAIGERIQLEKFFRNFFVLHSRETGKYWKVSSSYVS